MFAIGEDRHTSHGLTGLFKDSEAVLLYTEDHSRYSTSFRVHEKSTLSRCYPVFSAVINFEGTVGTEWEAPVLYLEEAAGGESALRHCASRIAAAMHARNTMPPAFFWSSWYYAYETMDDAMLEETDSTESGLAAAVEEKEEQPTEEKEDTIQNLPGVETVTGNNDKKESANDENEVKVKPKTPELILKYRKSLMTYVRVAGRLRTEEKENQEAAG
jgi:hypothetical protein